MSKYQNLLLEAFPASDLSTLTPHLKVMHFASHQVLFEANGEVNHVYFPTSAIVSLVVSLSTGQIIEIAMVGRDGVVGALAALDGRVSIHRVVVQVAGEILACPVAALKTVALKNPLLLSILMRHEQTMYAHASQSAACMAIHHIEARLCRWLLRARDLTSSDSLDFTQQYIAEMLGVDRTSVTLVAKTLQNAGIINYSRGKIRIVDVEAMQDVACECYSAIKSFYDMLLIAPIGAKF